jgi:uncharacterized protein
MIHPDTTVKQVSEAIGLGVFATRPIPCGSLIVVPDPFDQRLDRAALLQVPEPLRSRVETYLYHDAEGLLHLSWDHAKFMNHSCNSNTMLTPYGFELAVQDIAAGEELTSEYGLLNVQEPYALYCGCEGCREVLDRDDLEKHADVWDARIQSALQHFATVPQPLRPLLAGHVLQELEASLGGLAPYRSVRLLGWRAG